MRWAEYIQFTINKTMKKIKVCYVISSLSNQGPPNVLYNIIKYMDFSKFEISIITMVEEQKYLELMSLRLCQLGLYRCLQQRRRILLQCIKL